MSGKKYSKLNKRDYYNKSITDEIEHRINLREFSTALLMVNTYIDDYPEDILGPFLLARIYAKQGKINEAYELAKDTFEHGTFHNTQTKMNAVRLYSRMLIDLEKYDEAENILVVASYNNQVGVEGKRTMKVIYMLLQLYVDTKQYRKALDLINEFENDPSIGDIDNMLVKKGFIYMCLGRTEDAIVVLEPLKLENKSLIAQNRNCFLGQLYFDLAQKNDAGYINSKKENPFYSKAEEYLKASLRIKIQDYYESTKVLAQIAYKRHNFDLALQYVQTIIDNKDKQEVRSNTLDESYKICGKVYIKRGEFDKAKEVIEKIKDQIVKNNITVKYYYSIKDYDSCINLICSILSNSSEKDLEYYISLLVTCYLRKGEIDKAKYYVNCLSDDLETDYKNRFEAIYRRDKGLPKYECENYTVQQINEYSEDATIYHVNRKHVGDAFGNFDTIDEAREALTFAKEKIKDMDYVPSNLMNKYIITTENMDGRVYGECHGLVAITPMGTTNITTLYPISSYRSSYIDEGKKKEVKRLSQIEKFNKRYGNN